MAIPGNNETKPQKPKYKGETHVRNKAKVGRTPRLIEVIRYQSPDGVIHEKQTTPEDKMVTITKIDPRDASYGNGGSVWDGTGTYGYRSPWRGMGSTGNRLAIDRHQINPNNAAKFMDRQYAPGKQRGHRRKKNGGFERQKPFSEANYNKNTLDRIFEFKKLIAVIRMMARESAAKVNFRNHILCLNTMKAHSITFDKLEMYFHRVYKVEEYATKLANFNEFVAANLGRFNAGNDVTPKMIRDGKPEWISILRQIEWMTK